MQHVVLVSVFDCLRDGLNAGGGAVGGHRLFADGFGEVWPPHAVHREVIQSLVLADFVNRHDVRVAQFRGRPGFGPESLAKHLARERAAHEHFQGDDAVEVDLARLIDHAHAAARYFFEQLVITKPAPRGRNQARAARSDKVSIRAASRE